MHMIKIQLKVFLLISVSYFVSPVLAQDQKGLISNDFFTLDFDKKKGILHIRRYGKDFLSFTSAINTDDTTLVAGPACTFGKPAIKLVKNKSGTGRQITISGRDYKNLMEVTLTIYLPDKIPSLVFEVSYKNTAKNDIVVKSIEPLRVLVNETGGMRHESSQCLLNGAMYYDAGSIHKLTLPYEKGEPYGETKGGVPVNRALASDKRTVQSWWNIGIFDGYDKEAIVMGYLRNISCMGRIQLLKEDSDKISFVVESVYNEGHILKRGQSLSSEKVMINIGASPYAALETYAYFTGTENQAINGSIVNGWCHWFYSLDDYDEKEILQNAEYAAKHLKPYGLEYIQIDEGYQRTHGEWEGNERFPNGMKYLSHKIKSYGLKPGIWLAPFVVSENATIFRNNPDWFLKNPDGSLKRVGPWPGETTDWYRNENPKRYCLDITHPDAEKWFTDLIDTVVNNWGYEMLKIDFVAWSVFSAYKFYDPAFSPSQVYRKAFEIMRKVAGNKCHILDCGPGQVTAGLINSMRIEYDQNYGSRHETWKQYFGNSSSSAGALGKRYYYQNNTWTNDIDHICMDLLSPSQSQAVVTLVALSGGNTMSGDRLMNLSEIKKEILKKAFPSVGLFTRPVDLLESDPQTAFVTDVLRPFGRWTVAGFFNPDPLNPVRKKYPLNRLMLDPDKTYLCFDFWKEKFTGEINDTINVMIEPEGVTLYSLREKSSEPVIISTNRHIMQGAVELESVHYDNNKNALSGVSVGPEGSSHSVYVYIPDKFSWSPKSHKMFESHDNYLLKMADDNILRMDLFFGNTGKINWIIYFNK